MTTSGSIDFSISRDNIITEALQALQALGEGETPSANQLSDHSRTLNMMVKAWMSRGLNIWAIQPLTLVLEADKTTYTLGTDHITSSLVRTTLSADASSSSITVTSASGFADTYNIGVELDDGTMQWTTVSGAPSGTTITLATTLTGVASAGNVVYCYQSKYNALGIREVIKVIKRDKNQQDVPINLISRDEYYGLGDKTTSSQVTQVYFQPNLTNRVFYVYPLSSNETDTLEILTKRTLEDFDAESDTPDFPQEYYEALCLGLAYRLSRHYGKSISERQELKSAALEALWEAESADVEQNTSIYISYDGRRR